MSSTTVNQLLTLLGVALGVVLTYFSRALADRAGFRRDLDKRWEERKLDAYAQYVSSVKKVAGISRDIAVARGLLDRHTHLQPAEGIPLLDEAESQRELSTELLTLLAGKESIPAYRTLNLAVGRLESFARGIPSDLKVIEWGRAVSEYEAAFDLFYICVRAELGVPGEYVPRDRASDISIEDWIKKVRSESI